MLNILAAERMKLKRDRLLIICSAIAILWPIMLLGGITNSTAAGCIFRLQTLCQLSLYPVLSGFIITFLFHKEYADITIINNLTAPVARIKFLLGKLIVWGLWHIIITFIFLIITCAGIYFIFGDTVFYENLSATIFVVLKAGILNFGTLFPVAFIAVLQKKVFYPSLLFLLIVTASGFTGLLQPGLIGNIIPWIAVYLLIIPGGEVLSNIAYSSIAVCTVTGILLAMYSFNKQEL